jgi:hypothetical protein
MTRHAKWLRLSVLLALLLAAVLALLDAHGALSSSGGSPQARVARGCAGRLAPEAAFVHGAALQQMRAAALAALPQPAGNAYEQGLIGTPNLWTDGKPRLFLAPGVGATLSGAYEVRWWALDAEGRLDDIVVDLLRFANPAQAALALAVDTDARCHRAGSARAATLLAGGRLLNWVNPDGAYEQDTLLARGPFLYRVADAPPSVGADAAQASREHDRVATVTQVLACSLPQANCAERKLAAAATEAGAPAPLRPDSSRAWPHSAAQAAAYVRGVSLRPYDLAYMAAVQPAAIRHVAAKQESPYTCLPGRPSSAGAVEGTSPLLASRRGTQAQAVQSTALLLASEAAAARYVVAVKSAFEGSCARTFVRRAIRSAARSFVARSGARIRLGRLVVNLQSAKAPDTYRGSWPYRAAATRVSFRAIVTTRRGLRLSVSDYYEGFAFAYRRALVELFITSTRLPLPEANLTYLESVLVGRAEAGWGRPRKPAPEGPPRGSAAVRSRAQTAT